MSQAKISRIERGKTLPSAIDVERILRALEVPPEAAHELITLARRANVEHTSWRSIAGMGLWRKQSELKALAESATMQRLFLPAMPSGLLQVPEYARAALTPQLPSEPDWDTDKAVRARLDRQSVLDDPSRRFIFLLTEHAITWQYASRDVMAHQCAHMAQLSQRTNIDLAIVSPVGPVPIPTFNTFVVYDDRLVLTEVFSGEIVLRDPKDVSYHLELFDFFLARSLRADRARKFLLAARDEFMSERD
jgi:transcriptional regulator with XRE-family HTH domain